ncbi:PPOX class probable F420-dependent enzyme [Microlunatus sagamiharensis]|uniref:PPOX class probable F420-dependent enzyme n=1 Tax=Microlunatus sagamiharensis TaxID=546874 RepID=A0A1H2M8U0_9ACTN|nr:PPOX class F420-dependent oxidoreductase [Microlunatus sagamiharensis]SDU88906.1 PPOX class probable F420-dependent enzyme [Microlunatus sagamiharensis]
MPATKDGPGLLPGTRRLAEGRNFGSIATLLPSGAIQNQVIWVHTDGDRVTVNTEVHRAKYRNVERDDRVTLLITDATDPYHYAEVRGHVTETRTGPDARADIDALSQKYNGTDYPAEGIKSERVILYITPERQTVVDQTGTHGDDE